MTDYCCAPRGQLCSVAGPVAFYADLLSLISGNSIALPSDHPGPCAATLYSAWHWAWHLGSMSCCCNQMPAALQSCILFSLNLLVIRSLLIRSLVRRQYEASPWSVHTDVLSQRAKTKGNLVFFPLLVALYLSNDLWRAWSSPSYLWRRIVHNRFPWLGL